MKSKHNVIINRTINEKQELKGKHDLSKREMKQTYRQTEFSWRLNSQKG